MVAPEGRSSQYTTPRTPQKALSISFLGCRLPFGTAGGISSGIEACLVEYDTYSTHFTSPVMTESNQSKRGDQDNLKMHASARVECWSGDISDARREGRRQVTSGLQRVCFDGSQQGVAVDHRLASRLGLFGQRKISHFKAIHPIITGTGCILTKNMHQVTMSLR